MGADCADTDLSVDDVHSAEAGGGGQGGVSPTLAQPPGRVWAGPGIGARESGPQARAQSPINSRIHYLSPNSTGAGMSRPFCSLPLARPVLTCRSRPRSDTVCRACVWSRGACTGTAPHGSLGDRWDQTGGLQLRAQNSGGAPNFAYQRLALISESRYALHPLAQTHTHTPNTCIHSVVGPEATQFYTMYLYIRTPVYRFAPTLKHIFTHKVRHKSIPNTRSQKSTPTSQEHTAH